MKLSLMIFVIMCAPLFGVTTFEVSDISVEVDQSRGWTVKAMDWQGDRMINGYWGSSQGTVIYFGAGTYAGGLHGNETVLNVTLEVDGQKVPVADGQTHQGSEIVFTRHTVLLDALHLTSVLTVTDTGTEEYVVLKGFDDSVAIVRPYLFLGSRQNQFDHVASYDESGNLLGLWLTNADTSPPTNVTIGDAAAIAQYDSVSEKGIVSTIREDVDHTWNQWIADRTSDNKLYVEPLDIIAPVSTSTIAEATQTITVFAEPYATWEARAGTITAAIPEPSGAVLGVLSFLGLVQRMRRQWRRNAG